MDAPLTFFLRAAYNEVHLGRRICRNPNRQLPDHQYSLPRHLEGYSLTQKARSAASPKPKEMMNWTVKSRWLSILVWSCQDGGGRWGSSRVFMTMYSLGYGEMEVEGRHNGTGFRAVYESAHGIR